MALFIFRFSRDKKTQRLLKEAAVNGFTQLRSGDGVALPQLSFTVKSIWSPTEKDKNNK